MKFGNKDLYEIEKQMKDIEEMNISNFEFTKFIKENIQDRIQQIEVKVDD